MSRKGLILLLLGLVYVAVGLSYRHADLTPQGRLTLMLATQHLPLDVWAWIWCGIGGIAVLCAPAGRRQRYLGFGALMAMSVWWCAVYVTGWLLFGASRAITGALIYVLVIVMLPIVAGWPEQPNRPAPTSHRHV